MDVNEVNAKSKSIPLRFLYFSTRIIAIPVDTRHTVI